MEDKVLKSVLFAQVSILLELFQNEEDEHNSYDDIESFVSLAKYSIKNPIRRLQGYVELIIPSYSEKRFQAHFRMKRSTFQYILNLIKPDLIRQSRGHKRISPEKQFLIAIWKMATPDSYRSLREKFNVAKATAFMAVRRVTKAIVKQAPFFIKWPDGNKVEEINAGFATNSGFPKVIGAIDGTHININAPHINAESYINRKGHHSIQLQAICDHERRFIHCFAGHVGSVHDQRVFRLSEVYGYLEDQNKFPNDTHLLGDAAYTLHQHLMTPYRDNGYLTDMQKNYNYCHSLSRITIERAFTLLKGRFRSLLTVLHMERIDLIPKFILACCTLHNICLLQNDEIPHMEQHTDCFECDIPLIGQRRNNVGLLKRDTIANALIIRNT